MKNKDEKHKIELRAGEIEELLGRTPSGVTRWGITVFFGIITVVFIFCCFFRYPQIVTAPILITTSNPATWVVAKDNGNIDSILVRDNEFVCSGQILAAISNPCRLSDALRLKEYLRSLRGFISTLDIDSLKYYIPNPELGELQVEYVQLNKLLSEFELFCGERFHDMAYSNMLKEKQEQERYLLNLKGQRELCMQNESIISDKVLRDSVFYNQKIISVSDYDNARQQLIYGRIESSRVDLSINTTSLNIIQLENRLQETRTDYNSKMNAYRSAISSVYEQLLAKMSIWENRYVLKSPSNGIVSFSNVWSSNQQVAAGDKVFAVLSDSPGEIIGKCNIPVSGIGKIADNHSVTIKLDSYPFLEFGVLHGTLSNISKLPRSVVTPTEELKFVVAEIVIRQPLITSYNKPILLEGELTGIAEILTEDLTLIQHFISPLKHLWNRP